MNVFMNINKDTNYESISSRDTTNLIMLINFVDGVDKTRISKVHIIINCIAPVFFNSR